ncbi:MAG: hydantoinase/oxoprolinase family protein [Rhodospirillaceae bacterium]|nr:hydantoinase/oxoprolinase family protein [Rhodospirillaceae bacterium]MBT5456721.1 hydantoinase/oxoprolinase family protein [Rhodospirillaceae bacterium]
MSDTPARYRVGVDVGGTHTDLVLNDVSSGAVRIEKLPSSPSNPALAVLEGVQRLITSGVDPAHIDFFAHGTTVTTNALLEGKGAAVGLLINDGYRAICEVQTQARDEGNPYDHLFTRPPHITPPSLTREIGGRMDYAGEELTPLDRDAVAQAARELAHCGVRSFAVCYLFSFMNDAHERATADIIRETVPGAQISLSSQVLPQIREWPRYSTTLVNAYLVAVLADYIASLANGLDALEVTTPRRFLMQSNGGVMPLSANAENQTVHTLLSGPAAGVQGTAYLLGVGQGLRNIVTMDMGGTSCDIAFIQDGTPLEHASAVVANRIVAVPALDVSTISAGGGSIARVNAAGLLEVGPDSAGADPGPACYGKGGTLPTVTDADVASGFLNPDFFLGGKMSLDTDAARQAVQKHVSEPMEADLAIAAAGIVRVINARMADEIRVQAAKKGVSLTDFTLVPFGGAGPVHAAAVAQDLGIERVLVPASPGAFSAFGLLCADVVHDYVRSDLQDMETLEPSHVDQAFTALEQRAAAELAEEGLGDEPSHFVREMDLRYAGQGYELRVPLDGIATPLDRKGLETLVERFHDRHDEVHGHAARGADVEAVSYRLRAVVPVPKLKVAEQAGDGGGTGEPTGSRMVSDGRGNAVEAAIWRRADLPVGAVLPGPVIVEQLDSTTVVPAGWNVSNDTYGNLELTRGAGT